MSVANNSWRTRLDRCSQTTPEVPHMSALKRAFLLILWVGLVAGAVMAQTPAARRTIRVVLDNTYAPYSFQSDDGKLQGILVDQWQAWEKKTGVKVEIQAMDWVEALRHLQAGEFDVIDSIVATDERRSYFDFTPAYATTETSIFFRKDISGITDLASLKGFPVAVKTGNQQIEKLNASGVTTLILFQNDAAIIESAGQHKINVFVLDDASALYLLNKAGIEDEFRQSAPVFRDELRRAVRKGDAATLRLVSEGFAAIDPNELKRIDEKWFGRTINSYKRYLTYAGYAAAAAVLLMAFFIGWNRTLRRKISQRTALLHAREQEFRAIVENAPDQIIRYDREFRRVYVNPAVAETYGLPAEALIGKPIGSVLQNAGLDVKDDELAQLRQRIQAVFDTGKSCEFEITWPSPAGRKYYSSRLFPELDLNGSVINVLGIGRDITESKRAEEELKKEKEILEKIFDNIPVMIGFVGEDGRVKLVNPEWERSIGWTLKELQEQNVDIFVEAYPEVSYRQEILEFVAASTGESIDLKIRVRDGRVIDAACAVVRLSDGTRVAIAQDITERKQTEESLLQSERQLAQAQRLANVGSWEWNLRNNTVTWSDELYRIFSLQPGAIKAAGDAIPFIHPEDRDLVVRTAASSVENKEPYSFHYRILRPDGEERIIHSRGHVVTDENGNSIRVFGASQDVTEIRSAEERLRATSEQLRALSARVQSAREEEGIRIAREIHDELGGALTSLRWDLDAVDESISEAARGPQFRALRQKIAGMVGLIDTTINIVRRISSELRPVALDDVGLMGAVEWHARQFQERTGIIVSCECDLENVEISREQSTAAFRIFQEALTNILRHAQATRVNIQMKAEEGDYIFTISDNGRGITEAEQSGKRTLGLLGMRERAHIAGAKIDITGSEGKGTVVTMRIPIPGQNK